MRIYLQNSLQSCTKFHPDPIRNDGASGFLKKSLQHQKEEQEQDELLHEIIQKHAGYCRLERV